MFTLNTPTNAPWSITGLVSSGMIDEEGASLLKTITNGKNVVVICGPAKSGKSSVIDALSTNLRTPFVHTRNNSVPGYSQKELPVEELWNHNKPLVFDETHNFLRDWLKENKPHQDSIDKRLYSNIFWRPGTMYAVQARAAGGALNVLTEDGNYKEVADVVNWVITCSRKETKIAEKTVNRRVISKIEKVVGLGNNNTFMLETVYQAKQNETGATWEKVVTPSEEAFAELVDLYLKRPWAYTQTLTAITLLMETSTDRRKAQKEALQSVAGYGEEPKKFVELINQINSPDFKDVFVLSRKLLIGRRSTTPILLVRLDTASKQLSEDLAPLNFESLIEELQRAS